MPFPRSLTTSVFSYRSTGRLEAAPRRAAPRGHKTLIIRTARQETTQLLTKRPPVSTHTLPNTYRAYALDRTWPTRWSLYHISGDVELTNRELTAAILECCGASWDMVEMVEDRKGHDRRYALDDSALRAAGYAPRIPFTEGLRSTMHWYIDNREWWRRLKDPARA